MSRKTILLKSRPNGWVSEDNFELSLSEIPEPAESEMLLEVLYMSVDPYMRGRMNDPKIKSYIPPFQIGAPCEAGIVGRVIKSNGGKYPEGTLLSGLGPWSTHAITDGTGFNPLPDDSGVPLSYYLGILGMPGMTAYVGLKAIANLQEGESVYVSAASGAVGQVVGQIAKNMGCHVSGSAGSDDKVSYLTDDIGFDAAFNYKTADNLTHAIREANPSGVDVYFENVGGAMLEAVINNINMKGRIALCGMIADYNATAETISTSPRNLTVLIGRNVKMEGFIVSNYPKESLEWLQVGAQWIKEGKLKYRESVAEGVENAPQAFIDMLKGKNFGKQVVRIKAD